MPTSNVIRIAIKTSSAAIKHVSTEMMRTLVGVPITMFNASHGVESSCQDKTKDHVFRLKNTNLSPRCNFLGMKDVGSHH